MNESEMPIFSKTFDMLTWLIPAVQHFPRANRHDFTHRLLSVAFDLRDFLEEANLRRGAARLERLDRPHRVAAREQRLMKRLQSSRCTFGWPVDGIG